MRRGATLLLLLTALACSRGGTTSAPSAGPITTDGLLARSNLEAMIGGREGMLSRDPDSGSVRLTLVTLLQARASTYGRVEDLERAEDLGEQAVIRAPRSPEAWLARAASRSAVHRFREASADLDRAQSLRAEPDAIAAQRASIALATGQVATALTVERVRAERVPGMATLSALGVGLAESGDGPGASRAFTRALASYRDTSPFPVAFVEFQQGLLDERAGDLASAANHYRSVIERLPGHAQAAVHLAGIEIALGRLEAADAALRTLMSEASDPEIPATRSMLARRRGDLAMAAREESAARSRYHELLQRHPDAFADHAARFFLDREPAEALRWAVHNLGVRQTSDAYDLALSAALRAGDARARCDIARRAGPVAGGSTRLGILVSDALAVCGRAS
jgi:tetratricopeptide (TPR) repeat protein